MQWEDSSLQNRKQSLSPDSTLILDFSVSRTEKEAFVVQATESEAHLLQQPGETETVRPSCRNSLTLQEFWGTKLYF